MPFALPLLAPSGAIAQTLTVPTSWADVTLAQFVALFAPEPTATHRPAEILCGLPAGGLDNLAADDVQFLANLLAFATDPADVLELLPTPNLPDIGSQPYGVLLLAQQHLEAHPDRPWLTYAAYLLALYRVQLLWGKCNLGRVAACEKALLAAPVTEVYADATHFIGALKNWPNATPQTRPTTANPMAKKSTLTPTRRSPTGSGRFSAWMRRLAGPS